MKEGRRRERRGKREKLGRMLGDNYNQPNAGR
jgi:hypothetical protein